jgi:hypothetical protein
MAEGNEGTPHKGHIHDIGMLDLRSAKTMDDLSGITQISDVGLVLVPEHLMAAFIGKVAISDVGGMIPVPEGGNIQVMTGEIRITGEMLAGGNPDNVLILVGDVIITTPISAIGYKELRVFGQLTAPRGSETALASKMGQLSGDCFYYPANARTLTGNTTLGREFLEYLPELTALVVRGELNIENEVTVEQFRAKVTEVVLFGTIHAPKALVPLLNFLTQEKRGEIRERAV